MRRAHADRDELTRSGNGAARPEGRGRNAERPRDIPARGWKEIALRVKEEVKADHTSLSAAGVAFFGFLAAVPALAATVSIYALVADPGQVQARVESLFGALPEEAQALLTSQLESIIEQSGGALGLSVVVGILLSLWAASSGMAHLVEAVNAAYDEEETRGMVKRRGLALLFTVGAVLFVVATVGAISVLPALLDRTGLGGPARWALNLLVWPVIAIGFAVGLSLLYRFAPDRDEPRWRWVSWGSVVAVLIWLVGSLAFRFYAANFGSYNETYGSLAAVVLLLLWLFLTSFVVLLGAQVNAEMEHQTARDTTVGREQPMGQRRAVVADNLGGDPSAN
jgi:membrane protein